MWWIWAGIHQGKERERYVWGVTVMTMDGILEGDRINFSIVEARAETSIERGMAETTCLVVEKAL
jgi:hypothetical protein